MIPTMALSLLLLTTFIHLVRSENNWDIPCNDGWCEWDIGDGRETAFSSLIINASPNTLSDITPSNGFEVIDCNAAWDSGATNVTLRCVNENCNQLFDGAGAVDTIVRLPPSCGTGPFARVTRADINGGANLTTGIDGSVNRLNCTWSATLSYDLSSLDVSKSGKVNMFLTSTNVPGSPAITRRWATESLHKRGRDLELHRRGLFDSVQKAVSGGISKARSAGGQIVDAVTDTAGDVVDGARNVIDGAVDIIDNVVDNVGDANNFNQSETANLPAIRTRRNFPVATGNLDCGAVKASLEIDVDIDFEARIAFGVTVIGSIVPPSFDDFKIFATVDGSIESVINLEASIKGTFDTGVIELFSAGLPGLTIPGILTVGPQFVLGTEVVASAEVEVRTTIKTGFEFPNVNLVFPPGRVAGARGVNRAEGTREVPKQDAVSLSFGSPNITVTGSIDAHLIPRIEFGIDALGGIAEASIFLEVDASAQLTALIEADTGVFRDNIRGRPRPSMDETQAEPVNMRLSPSIPNARPQRPSEANRGSGLSGAVALDVSIFITAGVDASFFNLFDETLSVAIFDFTRRIFTRAFGDGNVNDLVIPAPVPAAKGDRVVAINCLNGFDLQTPLPDIPRRNSTTQ